MFANGRASQFIAIVGLSFVLSTGLASPSRADDAADAAPKAAAKEAEPVTTKDPQIALDDLELLLEPMTKGEIEAEVKGWFALLQAKEREITVAELDVRRKNREIGQLEKQKAAAADLAKATEEVRAAASDKDHEAAAQHLAEAQKNLAQTVATASKETVKEQKKAEATTAAMTKQADAAPPPASVTDSGTGAKAAPAAGDKEVLEKAAETASKKSETTGDTAKVEKWWRRPRRKPPRPNKSNRWPKRHLWRPGPRRPGPRRRRSPTPRIRPKKWPRRPAKPRSPRPMSRSNSSTTAPN
jgi:hypothetical protein